MIIHRYKINLGKLFNYLITIWGDRNMKYIFLEKFI